MRLRLRVSQCTATVRQRVQSLLSGGLQFTQVFVHVAAQALRRPHRLRRSDRRAALPPSLHCTKPRNVRIELLYIKLQDTLRFNKMESHSRLNPNETIYCIYRNNVFKGNLCRALTFLMDGNRNTRRGNRKVVVCRRPHPKTIYGVAIAARKLDNHKGIKIPS